MPSRRKRKRERRKAEATAGCPKPLGGWGPGAPVSGPDLLLLRTAIRQGWPVSQAVREQILNRLLPELETASARRVNDLARTFLEMDAANRRDVS